MQSDKEIIKTLAGELEHLIKLMKWERQQATIHREENERLRAALRDIACDCKHDCADSPYMAGPVSPDCFRNFARAALEEKE